MHMHHPLTEEMELSKMETSHHHRNEDDQMRVLYEASYKGCVSTLNSLTQQDPLILHKISSQTVFTENPIHISTLLGHLEFTKTLLSHKPNLAHELNSFRSTALHIASAEGHVEIVKELLIANVEACVTRDREGRIPLHYGVIRGRLEVVRELVRVKPESLRELHKGKTVFHLCVEYDHLEILKALMEYLDNTNINELLNSKDLDGGNTILHLAIIFKQVEIVKYLLSIPEIKEASNLANDMGFTASDIVERIPKDFKSLEIQVFINNGIKIEKQELNPSRQASTSDVVEEEPRKEKNWGRKSLKNIGYWFRHKDNYLEDMRGSLSMVSTMIATMTFQVVLNPPGGFVQQSIADSNSNNNTRDSDKGPLSCLYPFKNYHRQNSTVCPGEAMYANLDPDFFDMFIRCNTISFIASISVTLLLVSGFPLENKVVIWMLSMGMSTALLSLTLAYIIAINFISSENNTTGQDDFPIIAWTVVILGLAGVYNTICFVIWAVKKCKKIIKRGRTSMRPRNREVETVLP